MIYSHKGMNLKNTKGGVRITTETLRSIKINGIDLHTHSNDSDGGNDPAKVVRIAKLLGIEVLAKTDHDITGRMDEAIAEAERLGIRLIPGIELTCIEGNQEIHMLGLGIDHRSPLLRQYSLHIEEAYRTRAQEIARRVTGDPIHNWKLDYSVLNKKGVITRIEIARAVQNRGMSAEEFFSQYLDIGKKYCIEMEKTPVEHAIKFIKDLNGRSVWAHPGLSQRGKDEKYSVRKMARKFVSYGMEGVEVFYRKHTREETTEAFSVAEDFDLAKTPGSDFHNVIQSLPGQYNIWDLKYDTREIIGRLTE